MASVYANEIPEEQIFMTEYWAFRKKYYNAEEPEEFWSEMLSELETISQKHNSLYVDMMLLVCLTDIEVRFMRKAGSKHVSPDIKQLKHVLQIYENLRGRYDEGGERFGSKD